MRASASIRFERSDEFRADHRRPAGADPFLLVGAVNDYVSDIVFTDVETARRFCSTVLAECERVSPLVKTPAPGGLTTEAGGLVGAVLGAQRSRL